MPEVRELEKQLKVAAKTGKYIVGRREVLGGVKGSKLLVWSASANVPQQILDECRTLSVPAVKFDGNPVELGRACGIPFRVSVIALKAAGDADLGAFSSASDYGFSSHAVMPSEEGEEESKTKGKQGEEKKSKASKKEGKTTKRKVSKKRETTSEAVEEKAEPKKKKETEKPKKPARKKKAEKEDADSSKNEE